MQEIVQSVRCVIHHGKLPSKFIPYFESAFKKYQLYFPDWIREIHLIQDQDVDNIQITQSRCHRWITIAVNPNWDGDETDVLHEIAHTYSTNMWLYFVETILDLIPEEQREIIRTQYIREMEEDVQNLAYLMEKMYPEQPISIQPIPIEDIEF